MHRVLDDDPGLYGIPASVLAELDAEADRLEASLVRLDEAKAALRAALAEREQDLRDILSRIRWIANDLYNNPALDAADVARTGLAVRDTVYTPHVPHTPVSLMATPSCDGTVRLKWERSGNSPTTIFEVEASRGGGGWEVLATTTKTKATLAGFAPGIEARFRVRASKNERTSLPSPIAVVYPAVGDRPVLAEAA
ncbi:MAG TPA: hypothetical protein VM328_09255 [Fimbriimonadaceae bacterium]|nr:hypothetical protein [Fimbriimonadaceae bacterium]